MVIRVVVELDRLVVITSLTDVIEGYLAGLGMLASSGATCTRGPDLALAGREL